MTERPAESPSVLDEASRATLDATVARLIPRDDHGGGALEAGASRYIEASLAGDYRDLLPVYAAGLAALAARAMDQHGRPFAELGVDEQDALLRECEEGRVAPAAAPGWPEFFPLLVRHVQEGVFGDPAWGGNVAGAGWDLLGYPGPRLVWTARDQELDAEPTDPEGGAGG